MNRPKPKKTKPLGKQMEQSFSALAKALGKKKRKGKA